MSTTAIAGIGTATTIVTVTIIGATATAGGAIETVMATGTMGIIVEETMAITSPGIVETNLGMGAMVGTAMVAMADITRVTTRVIRTDRLWPVRTCRVASPSTRTREEPMGAPIAGITAAMGTRARTSLST